MFILAHLEGTVPDEEGHSSNSMRQLVTGQPQLGSRDMLVLSMLTCFCMQSRTPAGGVVLPAFRVSLPRPQLRESRNAHRNAQRFVGWVSSINPTLRGPGSGMEFGEQGMVALAECKS